MIIHQKNLGPSFLWNRETDRHTQETQRPSTQLQRGETREVLERVGKNGYQWPKIIEAHRKMKANSSYSDDNETDPPNQNRNQKNDHSISIPAFIWVPSAQLKKERKKKSIGWLFPFWQMKIRRGKEKKKKSPSWLCRCLNCNTGKNKSITCLCWALRNSRRCYGNVIKERMAGCPTGV